LIFWKADAYLSASVLNLFIISITYKITGKLFVFGTIISSLKTERVITDLVQGGLGL
jgi:hypothetical protein